MSTLRTFHLWLSYSGKSKEKSKKLPQPKNTFSWLKSRNMSHFLLPGGKDKHVRQSVVCLRSLDSEISRLNSCQTVQTLQYLRIIYPRVFAHSRMFSLYSTQFMPYSVYTVQTLVSTQSRRSFMPYSVYTVQTLVSAQSRLQSQRNLDFSLYIVQNLPSQQGLVLIDDKQSRLHRICTVQTIYSTQYRLYNIFAIYSPHVVQTEEFLHSLVSTASIISLCRIYPTVSTQSKSTVTTHSRLCSLYAD